MASPAIFQLILRPQLKSCRQLVSSKGLGRVVMTSLTQPKQKNVTNLYAKVSGALRNSFKSVKIMLEIRL